MKPLHIDDVVAQFRAMAQTKPKPRVTYVWASELNNRASVCTLEQIFQVCKEGDKWQAIVINSAVAGRPSSVANERMCDSRDEAAAWAFKWLSETIF